MNCEHEVRFTIKPTDDACRFHFDVRTYKDRIVAPDEYSGATTVTPSDDTQTLPTKDKTVRSDITVLPAPTEPLATNENGTFTPSDGVVGFSEVTVDIVPALDSLTVTENGLYLPESGVDGYDRVSVDVPWPSGSMTITENGTYDVAGYASAVVDVNVVPDLRPLSVSENGQYSPDGFDGYSGVTVDVEPNLTSLSVAENGLYLPESGVDGFDRVNVDVPALVLEPLTIDALSQRGTIMPTGDGFSQVTVEEEWDDTLYPITDETDPFYADKGFNAKHVGVQAGDRIIIEGYGKGRWWGSKNSDTLPTTMNITIQNKFWYLRFDFVADKDCTIIMAGYNASPDGGHSGNASYLFYGEYLRWKVIHATL